MQQWYQCPNCKGQVAFGMPSCPRCGQPFSWPTQQQPPPQYQQPQQPGGSYQQQPEPPKKKSSKPGIILLGIILFALATVGSCVICVMQPESPSDVTQSSNNGNKQLTSAEQDYLLMVSDTGVRTGNALTELGTLLQDANIENTQWNIEVAAQIVIIRGLCDEVVNTSPPSSMAHIHSKYLQAMSHFDSMTDLLVDGIDNMDESALNQGITEMELGTSLILEVGAMIDQLE